MRKPPAAAARLPWLTLAFVAAAMLASLVPAVGERLVYTRAGIARGELWRLFGAHLVHPWPALLFVDLGACLVLGAWCERGQRGAWCAVWASSALGAAFAVWVLRPDLSIYQGSSAVATGFFAFLATSLARGARRTRAAGVLLLLLLAAKLALELAGRVRPWLAALPPGVEAVALAHLAGALAGAACALSLRPRPDTARAGGCRAGPG
jgi:rhomboid family GlyGly-CTERM serine protease